MAKDTKKRIYTGFHFIYALFGILFSACIFFIIRTQYIEGDTWKEISETIKKASKPRVIEPTRGKIYCYNSKGGKDIVAASMKLYKIYFNGQQLHLIEKDLKSKGREFSRVDSVAKLSEELSKFFKNAPASHYRNLINRAYNTRKRVLISPRKVDYIERKELIKLPLFNSAGGKYNDCMISEPLNERIHPYGNLALRTVGDVFADKSKSTAGRFGIEMEFDSLLRGQPGLSNPLKVSRRKTVFDEEKKAIDGADITLTLDMDMQDIVHRCLLQQVRKLGVERGCAILMDVKTGEIKAMSNLYQGRNGYFEGGNMAISDMNPPGSTFKIVSMMVALEQNIIEPNTVVNAYDKRYPKVTDHRPHEGWRAITASDVLVYSSNVGTSNIIGGAFENNPMAFVDAVKKSKFAEPFDIMLPGATKVKIGPMKYWKIKDTINSTDLPTLSFGYQVAAPPIYMLRYYNAIANDGEMVNPFVVKEISEAGKVKKFSTEVVTSHIASSSTVKALQQMLVNVVEQKGGTGYYYRSSKVRFAGKTGTAVFRTGGKMTDQVSFCGYFPVEEPRYSCIVVMEQKGIWGTHSCEVFKNIAEQITALNTVLRVKDLQDTIRFLPNINNGQSDNIKYILDKVDVKYKSENTDWAITQKDTLQVNIQKLPLIENLVPNVVGMGARDAVFLLEKFGLRVKIYGKGVVRRQSLEVGSRVNKGQTIVLELN